jgi:hypothetical protein
MCIRRATARRVEVYIVISHDPYSSARAELTMAARSDCTRLAEYQLILSQQLLSNVKMLMYCGLKKL